jgi:hypothetical protein
MELSFIVRDVVSEVGGSLSGSASVNADRAGQAGPLAWVIDGATDVLVAPLLRGGSDAAWYAAALDAELRQLGKSGAVGPLPALTDQLAAHTSARFAAEASRPPAAVHENPSAAGILLRLAGAQLEWLALADCELVVQQPGGAPELTGTEPDGLPGDALVVAAMDDYRRTSAATSIKEVRAGIWPMLRARRDLLNQPGGYGVFSTLPTPPQFVRTGTVPAAPGSWALLATDGFTAMAEIFSVCTLPELLPLARKRGLGTLLAELRDMERGDTECRTHRRTKAHDDATAILLEVVASS